MSVSAPSEPLAPAPASRLERVLPWILSAAYFAAHVPFLAPTLEDIDSQNFALGLRHFDVAQHQPHPPGYPIYIALGKVSLAVVHALRPALGQAESEAQALAWWSALGGAAAVFFAWRLFAALAAAGRPRGRPLHVTFWSTLLLACNPLLLISGVRPMSDMPGLGVALAAQAMLIGAALGTGGSLIIGAFLAGLGLGIRSQIVWLTAPLVLFAMLQAPRNSRWRGSAVRAGLSRPFAGRAGRAALAYIAGVLLWAVPLIVLSGGVNSYLRALGSQAIEDLTFVDILVSNPTPRQLLLTLYRTLVLPWNAIPLAAVVLMLACIGLGIMLARERRVLAALLCAFAPYFIFHLVFQETITVRYALPMVPLIAFAAVRAVASLGRLRDAVALPLAAAGLLLAMPGVVAYGRDPHPALRAMGDIARRAEVEPPAFLAAHIELRRAVRVVDPPRVAVQETAASTTWLQLVRYWADGGRQPVWLLADPRRTDVELIDPASRSDVVRYRWSVSDRPEMSGVRPAAADWYRLPPPGWFVAEGWALTPETGGVAAAMRAGPDRAPITGYVRRRGEPMRVLIGGRHMGTAADGAAAFEMAIDGQVIDRWPLTFDERNFLRFVDLPGGIAGEAGSYARVTVASRAPGPSTLREPQGRPEPSRGTPLRAGPPVAIRQFDAQPASRLIFGYGEGWHEDEFVFQTGLRWRWTSERSVLQVRGPAQPVRLTLRGESPLRYFDEAPTVRVTAAGRVLGTLTPARDFTWSVDVPAEALAAAAGAIAVETDRVFRPADRGESGDARRLGLRIFECIVQPIR